MANRLTGSQRIALAAKISAQNWMKIAVAYLELEDGVLSSLKSKHREDVEALNEEIIKIWANKNRDNQVKVCVVPVPLQRITINRSNKYSGVCSFC